MNTVLLGLVLPKNNSRPYSTIIVIRKKTTIPRKLTEFLGKAFFAKSVLTFVIKNTKFSTSCKKLEQHCLQKPIISIFGYFSLTIARRHIEVQIEKVEIPPNQNS